jgi:hypothetical protein
MVQRKMSTCNLLLKTGQALELSMAHGTIKDAQLSFLKLGVMGLTENHHRSVVQYPCS